jgi:hypothetical protein
MKGDAANILPAQVVRALLAALRAIPPRATVAGGWRVACSGSEFIRILESHACGNRTSRRSNEEVVCGQRSV